MGKEERPSGYSPRQFTKVLPPYARSLLSEMRQEKGIALLLALFIMLSLSGLALSLVLLTDSQIRLGKTLETQAQVYYAALAGLEEARGRLNASAPDSISGSLPTAVTQVLYLVNSRTLDPVQPTNASNPYYDYEYAREFSGGLGSATVLPAVASDQPGAGTASTIPYKWVRITLKTEYSSGQDADQNGVLDSTTPIKWDGTHQNLTTGVSVYKLTALAVDPSRIRKIVQTEVAGTAGAASTFNPSAGAASAASASLNGVAVGSSGASKGKGKGLLKKGVPNLVLDGTDACGVSSLPGIMTGGTVNPASPVATINGVPTPTVQSVAPFPQSASALINALRTAATTILSADPSHVTVSGGGTSYVGSNVVLGSQPSGTTPAQPKIVYSDKPLTLSGASSAGDGVLLVQGNLSITGGFDYRGLIVADGTVTLASDATGSIVVSGSLISSGNLSADSSASTATSLNINYDFCAVTESYQYAIQLLPNAVSVLASRELSY
jgi:hypothetical protein